MYKEKFDNEIFNLIKSMQSNIEMLSIWFGINRLDKEIFDIKIFHLTESVQSNDCMLSIRFGING